MPRKKNSTEKSGLIDINLRFRNDGGVVYAALSGIEDSYARGDRVRQWLYLGLLTEQRIVNGHLSTHTVVGGGGGDAGRSVGKSAKGKQVQEESSAEKADMPQFEAEDLTAIFG